MPPTTDRPDRAGTPAPADPAPAVGRLGEEAVRLAASLVRTGSVNPGLVPGAAGEREVVELLRARLEQAGFETHVVTPPDDPDRPSLVAAGPAAADGPTVVLTGHVDTVGVGGMPDPFGARLEADRLLGRGACDMKAGVAALVVAAEEIARRGTPGRVVLALVADEEDRSLGTEAVLRALPGLGVRPHVALVGEPTWLARTADLRGYAVVEVTLTGRPAHSSQPEHGVNAVTHLGRLLAAVEDRHRRLAPAGGSLMVTVAEGGESAFVLARTARAVVERRTVPGEDAAGALAEVRDILDRLRADDPTVDATAHLVTARPAWRLDPDGPAAELADALDAALATTAPDGAGTPEPFHAPYWMEAPLWQDAGIPALVCGPAGGGLHAADEWVDLGQVRRYTEAVVTAVGEWVRGH
ncbi:MAG TPA: M20/M25/M40 family metallo-hydrolase [Phycicoccus sp.]|nr:M20/M25/M40 family metallo-hydrolase [Phycicoccus sp.]